MTGPALEVSGLVKRYGATLAVDGLSLRADAGAVLALLGPNGAGKTTTVEVCEGFRKPDAGEVRVLGERAGSPGLRARVGVMPQQPGGYPGARAAELLELVASYYAEPLPVSPLLDRLGLGPVRRTAYRRLSGGQQQRLSLAMALVGRPELVFLDEPTSGLDVQARRETWQVIRELRAEGTGVVLTTHAMEEAEQLADAVVIIDAGRVVAQGSPAELTRGAAQRTVRFRARPGLDGGALQALLPPGSRVGESPPGCYEVQGDLDPGLLAAVTAWLGGQGAAAEDLTVSQRSLEDVFLELTGRDLRA